MVSRLLTLCLLVLTLSQCTTTKQPAPLSGAKQVNWPAKSFTTVRGFAYHCDAEGNRDFVQPGGRFHKGILQPAGVELSAEQVQRLKTAITTPFEESWRTPCYAPHHAFVFYDANGKMVSHLEICFTCNKFIAHPGGLPEYIDMGTLWSLVQELGLPTGSGRHYYRDIYNRQTGGN